MAGESRQMQIQTEPEAATKSAGLLNPPSLRLPFCVHAIVVGAVR